MSGISGKGSAKLAALRKGLAEMASERFLLEANRQLAAEALTQLQLGFRESRDPYGEPWAPLVRREGKPLLDTGRLRNSFSRTGLTARAFVVGTNVIYAATHQFGRGKIAARPMMPSAERGPSPIWDKAFDQVIERMIKKLFEK